MKHLFQQPTHLCQHDQQIVENYSQTFHINPYATESYLFGSDQAFLGCKISEGHQGKRLEYQPKAIVELIGVASNFPSNAALSMARV